MLLTVRKMSGFRLGPRSLVCLSISLMMFVQGVPLPLAENTGFDMKINGGAVDRAPLDDWPQFHNDPSRTGVTASPAPSANTTIWTYATGVAVNSSPAVDGSVVFIGSADGNLYSFNASTGELLWKAATGGKVCSSPAVWGAYVYVGSEDGDLHCYYKDNGTERFIFPAGAPVRAPVLVISSTVVFGTDNGTIVALTLDGAFAWSNQTPYPIKKAPAAAGGIVLAVSGPGLFAFNISDGAPRWNTTFGPGNLSHPCIGGGQLFVGSEDGWVRAFDPANGNLAWAGPAAVAGAVACSPAFSNGSLYLGTRGQRFYGLDASNGSISFNVSAGGPVESSAAVSGQTVIFGSAAGLSAVDNGTGAPIWSLAVTGGVVSSPAVSRGRCYAGSVAGTVLALGFRHTARITQAVPPSARQGEDVGFNGTSPDCVPVAYQWSSDLDGIISTKNTFNITTLTLGTHRISLRIQDDNWTWSGPETTTTEVSPSAEWPMFKKDTSHRGFSEGEAPLTKTVVWSASVGGNIDSSPVVYNGTVFIGTRLNGALYALDINTGARKWSWQDNLGNIGSAPACADGMVFVGDDAGNTIAFDADPSDGIDEGIQDLGGTNYDIIWLYQSKSSIWGSPVVAAGKVIVPLKSNATICALDEFSGVPVWKYSLPDPNNSSIWNTPVVDSGLVMFGSSNRHFYALDLGTGREVWNFTAGGMVRESSACVFGGIVYFGSWDNKLYALDIHNGTQKWNSTTGDDIDSSPAVDQGRVLFGSSDFTFRALDAQTGQEIWTCNTIGGAIESSPAVGGGLVFFAALDGRIYALNESTGKTVWTYDKSAGQGLKSSPALVGGRLFIGLENGTVLAFGKAPDLSVPSSEITLTPPRPQVGQQTTVSAHIYNIGSLDASATIRITEGPAGSEIFTGNKMVPAGGFVDVSGNWTVGPGVHHLVVQATDTVPYEANLDNNIGSMEYSPPPRPGWSMFKYGPERTSARDLTTPNSNVPAWTCETRDFGFSSPVTAGNRLYQASGSTLLAFDIDVSGNGVLVWSHTAGGTIRSTPAVSNIVVFGSMDGNITALNEWDGSVVWNYATGGEVVSSPLIQSDTVYVGSSDGYLYSIGLFDQRLQWKKYLGGPVESSPAYDLSDEMLVVGCQYGAGGRIYCLYTNGTEVWNLTVAAPVGSTPAIRGGMAWVGCDDGFLYALDVVPDGRDDGIPDPTNSTTDIVWMTNLSAYVDGDDARVRSSPAVLEGSVFVGAGRDAVVAINSSTGKVQWHRNIGPLGGKYMFSSPAVSPGRLFIGGPGLFALNTRNGATVWSYVPGSWVWSSPAISLEAGSSFKGMVFAVTEDGRLCAFSSTVNIPPVARISSPADDSTYRVGEIIHFNASESWDPDGEIVNWTWELGDGNRIEGESVAHNYTDIGNYTINLTVSDDRGLEGRAVVNISVRPNSAPRLGAPSVSRDEGTVNDNFTFTVTYFDADNDSAMYVRAFAGDQPINLTPVEPEDTNTTDGKDYFCDTRLLSGLLAVYFDCWDGVLDNSTPVVANLTVTNRRIFGDPDRLSVELYYAGRGEVLINISAFPNDADAGLKKISNEFEIKTSNIDIWWWANISWNISSYNQSGINRNTIRIFKYNPSANTTNKWVAGENAGLDLENNWTWANVTSLSNFAVMAQLPPNHRPVARLGKDITIMEGETVFFNASASSDEDNDSLEYNWTFGDSPGKAPVKGDSTAEHKYTKPGRYTVTVFVSDGKLTSNATQEVIVKQKGGEQFVIVIVVIIILVVAIIFILPRGEEKGTPRRRDEEEFKKGMEVRAKKDNTGKNGGKKGSGPPDKAEEE
jgi:outer membrane protein assembly factor BamB/PKD repeat protein